MKPKVRNHLHILIAVLAGAVCGYLYYRVVGCASGSCAITSSPVISTLYGGIIGGLLGSVFAPNAFCGCCKNNSDAE